MSKDYRDLRGEEMRQAQREYDRFQTGPKAVFHQLKAREHEFAKMIAPGGSLADLESVFEGIVDAHERATA